MQSYGRGRVVPHAIQNHNNARGYLQNQQSTMYTTYAPYLSNPPYLQQGPIGYMTYAPYPQYSQQEIGYMTYAPYPLYSQQEIEARLLQDPIANDMVLHHEQNQNCLFHNHYRRETLPEYRNGEMVMVRCNQQKWLNGVIQRMSTRGMEIWIIDANILVNVPLVLLPTCVFKMATYSALESLPQDEPMWTITNHGEYQKVLIQCVRPAHHSHCQLVYVLDNNVCAICKLHISNITNMVSPWNCCHQVHNHCLQLQMQQYSDIICPFCNEIFFHQLNLSEYSSFAHPNPNNGQQQQFNCQCVCGFKIAMIDNINATIICPNCHQPLNVNSMTTNLQNGQALNNMNINPMMVRIQNRELSTSINLNPRTKILQSKEPPINIDLLPSYSKFENKIPESSKSSQIPKEERFFNGQDFKFGWPMQSISSHKRLEAIEEGLEVNTSSLESTTIEERHEEPSYFPLHLQALNETFENNNMSYQNVVAMRSNDQDLQPPSSFQNSLQDGSIGVPYPIPTSSIQSERPHSQILLQDSLVDATLLSLTTPIQREQFSSQSSLQNDLKDAPSPTSISFFPNELWKDNAFVTKQFATSLSKDVLVPHIKLIEVEEANKSIKQPEMDKMTITTIEEYNLWKKVSEPNATIVAIEDQSLGKKASQKITSIVEIEGPKIWEKANEINTNYETTKDHKLKKRESELVKNFGASEGEKLEKASEPNTTIANIDVQKLWKRTSDPNTTIATTKDQRLEKKMTETTTTIGASKEQKLEKKVNEPKSIHSTIQNTKLWEKETKLNTAITTNERHTLWKRISSIDCTKNLRDNEESEEIEKANSSNDFVPSSSSITPMYINHFDEATKGQKWWRRASAIDWSQKLVSNNETMESEKIDSSMDSSSTPMYVNHFANFVKLAMGDNSSIAKDIIRSASTSASSSILNSPLPLESITPTRISPPSTFFTRASSLFTQAPTWIIHNKNLDEATSTSPTWITVIKDGIDSRKDDKQWE